MSKLYVSTSNLLRLGVVRRNNSATRKQYFNPYPLFDCWKSCWCDEGYEYGNDDNGDDAGVEMMMDMIVMMQK